MEIRNVNQKRSAWEVMMHHVVYVFLRSKFPDGDYIVAAMKKEGVPTSSGY